MRGPQPQIIVATNLLPARSMRWIMPVHRTPARIAFRILAGCAADRHLVGDRKVSSAHP